MRLTEIKSRQKPEWMQLWDRWVFFSSFDCNNIMTNNNSESFTSLELKYKSVAPTNSENRDTNSMDHKHEQVADLLSIAGVIEMPWTTLELSLIFLFSRTGWVSLGTSRPLTRSLASSRPRRRWPRPSKPCRSSVGSKRPGSLVCDDSVTLTKYTNLLFMFGWFKFPLHLSSRSGHSGSHENSQMFPARCVRDRGDSGP